MPFREKMKKAFRRPSTASTTATTTADDPLTLAPTKSSSSAAKKKPKIKAADPLPSNIYKPGEMPRPKYRGPYNKQHQEKLSAFSFSDAWRGRRGSNQSQYSPMGSRLPSRDGKSGGGGRRKSLTGSFSLGKWSRQASYVSPAVAEAEGDSGDVGNVGLSRHATHDRSGRPRTAESTASQPRNTVAAKNSGPVNGAVHGAPFTENDLALAMTQSSLKVR